MSNFITKLGSSMMGVAFGAIIIILSIWSLSWNEGKAVRVEQGLNEIGKVVREITIDNINPEFNKKAVYLTGDLIATEPVVDSKFGIETQDLKLKRLVEMYQWQENIETKEKTMSDGTTKEIDIVTYEKIWSESPIDSFNFEEEGHNNPSEIPLESLDVTAAEIMIGKHMLSPGLARQLTAYTDQKINKDNTQVASIAASLDKEFILSDNIVTFNNRKNEENSNNDNYNNNIGAIKVTFTKVSPQKASIIAQQIEDTFEAYKTKSGESIEILKDGTTSDVNMIADKQAENKSRTWMMRMLGIFGLFIGFSLILKPLSVITTSIPLVGSLVNTGISLVSGIMALSTGLVVIAVSWFAYRPLLSGAIIVVVVGGVILFLRQKNLNNS